MWDLIMDALVIDSTFKRILLVYSDGSTKPSIIASLRIIKVTEHPQI